MSQNGNSTAKYLLIFSISTISAVTLSYTACSKGFQSAPGISDGSADISSACTTCGTNTGVGTGTSGTNFSSLALSVSQILELAVSNFPGLATLASCESVSACAGSGPSSESITANCSPAGTSLTGQTTLTFNAAQCSEISSNQITISPNLHFTSSVESFAVSSAQSVDYLGNQSGGGIQAQYSISSATAQISDLGIHLTSTSSSPLDISTHSTAPANATVNILSLQMNVNGGMYIFTDNLAQYSANMTFSNLTFGPGCACPVGGSLSGTLSGSLTGPVSMVFNSTCGSMTVTAKGTTSTSTVPGCTPL